MTNVILYGVYDFLGFSICKYLLDKSYTVYGIDSLNRNMENETKELKHFEIGRNANFSLIDFKEKKIVQDVKIVIYAIDDVKDIELEKEIVCKILEYCNANDLLFVFYSSLEVFSGKEEIIDENTAVNPRSIFGEYLLSLEKDIIDFSIKHQSKYLIFRLPTVFGPWQPLHKTYMHIMCKERGEIPIDVIREDVIFIDDVCNGLVLALEKKCVNEIFHLGSGKKNEWESGLNTFSNIGIAGNNIDVSIKKANKRIGFKQMISTQEGIKIQQEFVRYMKHLKSEL